MEGCKDLDKVRKGCGVSSQSRCLHSSVGLMAATLYACYTYSLSWTVTHPSGVPRSVYLTSKIAKTRTATFLFFINRRLFLCQCIQYLQKHYKSITSEKLIVMFLD